MLALALALTLTTIEGSMYDAAVTDLTAENFDSLVINSAETWLVKFYAPWCGHCKSSAPAFSKAAKKLLGVARLGVVNCDDHAALAQRFDVNGFPTLKLFKGEGRSRGPSDYNQARSSKAFVDHVKYAMPSFVARVKPSGLDAFFNDLPSLPHALLFTDKSSTSPLYKGMSARFRGKMAFGEVRKTDADADLLSKYSVHKFPTLLTFGKGDAEAETGRKFEGAMDPASLEKFFTSVVAGTDGEVEEAKTEEKVFAQPQAYSGDVMDIVGSKQYESVCDARKDGRLCGLAVLPGGLQHQLVNGLKTLAQRYQYDNMAFAVLDCAAEGGVFADWLGIDREKGGFIIMKARKRKFATLEGELDEETVGRFLDRVVGGDARFKKITTDLPEWVVEEPVKDNLDDEKNETKEESDESGQCGTEPPKDGSSCGASKEDL